ncbi:MAG: WecB/TagA/CpsF family glycosyltransferase [Lachnospiraceae bacterium]|jgi:N-acetylglucosaminyldiphosphoundecaprenol N-acetyl-beta-D-mannosaminyltransferase|nr:WecB/TagA/CpsF family glycosyltransferase [Lachnospiraceae bacterium]
MEKDPVWGMDIVSVSAKEAFEYVKDSLSALPVSCMAVASGTELAKLSAIENDNASDGFIKGNTNTGLKLPIFDILVPADIPALILSDINDKKLKSEVRKHVFTINLLDYLNEQKKRVYLLAESEDDGMVCFDYLSLKHPEIDIKGIAVIDKENRADELIVNDINGNEVDIIISGMSLELQTDFLRKNKHSLNTALWVGVSLCELTTEESEPVFRAIKDYILGKRLCRKIESFAKA